MTKHLFFIGVDGGATKSIVRVEDESGRLLGREKSGPANIRLSVNQAWESILTAFTQILQAQGISLGDNAYQFHAAIGLAGCEIREAYDLFLRYSHPFHTLTVTSDSHTACLGAHSGRDGAIIIAGTGVVGYQIEHQRVTKIGGWGFPHDDEGGGAWMGAEAVKLTLKWLDGRLPESGIAKAVYAHYQENLEQFLLWANQANSSAFAALAPFVIQQSQLGDQAAQSILKRAATAIDAIGVTLLAKQHQSHQPLPCSLVGGVTDFIEPYLSEPLRARLLPCQMTPDAGAVMIARKEFAKEIK